MFKDYRISLASIIVCSFFLGIHVSGIILGKGIMVIAIPGILAAIAGVVAGCVRISLLASGDYRGKAIEDRDLVRFDLPDYRPPKLFDK